MFLLCSKVQLLWGNFFLCSSTIHPVTGGTSTSMVGPTRFSMLSISWHVHMCVCLSVCLSVCSLLRYRLTVFLPPLPKVGCPIFLEIRNPWGKVMERSGLTFEHFCLEVVYNRRAKKSLFFCWFCLTKHGGNHASRWIRDLWSKGISLILAYL